MARENQVLKTFPTAEEGEVKVGQLLALKAKIKAFLFREIAQQENL